MGEGGGELGEGGGRGEGERGEGREGCGGGGRGANAYEGTNKDHKPVDELAIFHCTRCQGK